MVEGPGCKVKGEKLRKKILNLKVTLVNGTLINANISRDKKREETKFHKMIGKNVREIQTLGKELFIFFHHQDFCLRMHFLMDGGFRLNGKKLDSEMGGEAEKPTLLISFSSGDQLAFNKSAADIRDAAESLARVGEYESLDICSDNFSHSRAVARMLETGHKLVCDALLDQTLLPGVGNIIKNEALFDSGIMPDCRVSILTEAHVSHLVKMTRDFSIIFYKCRRDGKPLWPYLKLYNKEKCKQCGGKIIKTKMGEDSARLTWFCGNCQYSDPNKIKSNLPTKNSLLGWIQSSERKSVTSAREDMEETWTCAMCTLVNKKSRKECEVCLHENHTLATPALNESVPSGDSMSIVKAYDGKFDSRRGTSINMDSQNRNGTISNVNNYGDTYSPALPSMNQQHSTTVSNMLKRKGITEEGHDCSVMPRDKKGKFTFQQTSHNKDDINITQEETINSKGAPHAKPLCRTFIQNTSNVSKSLSQTQSQGIPTKVRQFSTSHKAAECPQKPGKFTAPNCPEHKAKCKMRQVHKEGKNYHRMFWCCPTRTRCNFFKWADEKFPICEGHGKRAVLRTVLKQGSNNGRKFFACPLAKKKQCGFFEWAEGIE